MSEDSSLTEFLGTDDQSDDEDRGPARGDATATVTYAWDDAGGECALCEETVTALWRDGSGLVCVACKSW